MFGTVLLRSMMVGRWEMTVEDKPATVPSMGSIVSRLTGIDSRIIPLSSVLRLSTSHTDVKLVFSFNCERILFFQLSTTIPVYSSSAVLPYIHTHTHRQTRATRIRDKTTVLVSTVTADFLITLHFLKLAINKMCISLLAFQSIKHSNWYDQYLRKSEPE